MFHRPAVPRAPGAARVEGCQPRRLDASSRSGTPPLAAGRPSADTRHPLVDLGPLEPARPQCASAPGRPASPPIAEQRRARPADDGADESTGWPASGRRSSRRRARCAPRRVLVVRAARARGSPGRGRAGTTARRTAVPSATPPGRRRSSLRRPAPTRRAPGRVPPTRRRSSAAARRRLDEHHVPRRDPDVVLPRRPLQLHRLGRAQRPAASHSPMRRKMPVPGRPSSPPSVVARSRRRPRTAHARRRRPPGARARRSAPVSPPANSSGSKNREYCEGESRLGEGQDRARVPEHAGVGLRLLSQVGDRLAVAELDGVEGAGLARRPCPAIAAGTVGRRHRRHRRPTAAPAPPGTASPAGRAAASPPSAEAAPRWPRSSRHRSSRDSPTITHAADQPTCVWQSRGMPTLSEDLAFRGLIHQMTDPELPKRLDQPGPHGLRRLRPDGRQPPRGQPAPALHAAAVPGGRAPAHLPGRRRHRHDRRPGRQAGRAPAAHPRDDRGLPRGHPPPARPVPRPRPTALLLNNADWLGTLSTLEFLRDVGKHFTVNQMVAKESVKSRFERPDQGITYTEFSYMLLQAYDFLRLHVDHGCDLQIGGSDQWGNITMGVELIRKVCGDEVWGLTTPLVVKADGTKYGKTESGTVWLDPAAHQPLRHVPVLRQHARRAGRRAAPVPHLPRARRDRDLDARDGGAPRAPRGPAGAGPRRRRPGARRGRGGQVRGGVRRPLRRGDRRAERGDAARRDRGRADHRPCRGPSSSTA